MGHLPPYLLQPADGEGFSGVFLDGSPNRVLGWFDDPGYSETVTDLAPGERLVLFTDGFLEAKAPSGDMFGEERLATALNRLAPLAPEQLGDALVVEVERFAAGKLEDDLTMLVLGYRGPVRDGIAGTGRLEVES